MKTSVHPPATNTSASDTVATVMPAAPASSWRAAILEALVRLRLRSQRESPIPSQSGHRRHVLVEHVEIHSKVRRGEVIL